MWFLFHTQLSRQIEELRKRIECLEREIEKLKHHGRVVRSFKLYQIIGGNMANSITGIIAGQKGSFQALAVPAGSTVTGIPTWASDNPLAVVSPAADGMSAVVTVDATATGSFNLSVSSTNPDGSVATGSASVPVLPAPPPPPVPVASFDINQTA